LDGRKGIRPVKKLSGGVWRGYLFGAKCKCFAYGPADAATTPSPLAPVKSRMVYLSGAGLPRLTWKKRRQTDVVVVVSTKVQYTVKHVTVTSSSKLKQ